MRPLLKLQFVHLFLVGVESPSKDLRSRFLAVKEIPVKTFMFWQGVFPALGKGFLREKAKVYLKFLPVQLARFCRCEMVRICRCFVRQDNPG